MARNAPTIICSHSKGDTIVDICEAESVYAVFYQGRPIMVRTHNPELAYQGYKYGKTSYPNPGHALRLAQELNRVYETDQFTVAVLNSGRTVKVN